MHVQQAVSRYCLTFVQSFEMISVGKCGVVERALCDGANDGLACLSKATETDNYILFWDLIM